VKRNKPRKEAEDRRKPRRRALRDIEDREWDEESKHLDDDLSELLEGDGIAEDMEDDWLP
jgi:hypothetical protein